MIITGPERMINTLLLLYVRTEMPARELHVEQIRRIVQVQVHVAVQEAWTRAPERRVVHAHAGLDGALVERSVHEPRTDVPEDTQHHPIAIEKQAEEVYTEQDGGS